eukprot:2258441-Pleurochrysis_carterae.AAC.1
MRASARVSGVRACACPWVYRTRGHAHAGMYARARACVRVRVRACARACWCVLARACACVCARVRACARVCACGRARTLQGDARRHPSRRRAKAHGGPQHDQTCALSSVARGSVTHV